MGNVRRDLSTLVNEDTDRPRLVAAGYFPGIGCRESQMIRSETAIAHPLYWRDWYMYIDTYQGVIWRFGLVNW